MPRTPGRTGARRGPVPSVVVSTRFRGTRRCPSRSRYRRGAARPRSRAVTAGAPRPLLARPVRLRRAGSSVNAPSAVMVTRRAGDRRAGTDPWRRRERRPGRTAAGVRRDRDVRAAAWCAASGSRTFRGGRHAAGQRRPGEFEETVSGGWTVRPGRAVIPPGTRCNVETPWRSPSGDRNKWHRFARRSGFGTCRAVGRATHRAPRGEHVPSVPPRVLTLIPWRAHAPVSPSSPPSASSARRHDEFRDAGAASSAGASRLVRRTAAPSIGRVRATAAGGGGRVPWEARRLTAWRSPAAVYRSPGSRPRCHRVPPRLTGLRQAAPRSADGRPR